MYLDTSPRWWSVLSVMWTVRDFQNSVKRKRESELSSFIGFAAVCFCSRFFFFFLFQSSFCESTEARRSRGGETFPARRRYEIPARPRLRWRRHVSQHFCVRLLSELCVFVFPANKSRRVELSTASLLKVAPTDEERKIVHSLFLNTLDTKYDGDTVTLNLHCARFSEVTLSMGSLIIVVYLRESLVNTLMLHKVWKQSESFLQSREVGSFVLRL